MKAAEEKDRRQTMDMEKQKPILKDFFRSEMREINKILADYAKQIESKRAAWNPDPTALAGELRYLEQRFEKAVQAYNQFMVYSADQAENAKMRELKNGEERVYRRDFLKVSSVLNSLQSKKGRISGHGSFYLFLFQPFSSTEQYT